MIISNLRLLWEFTVFTFIPCTTFFELDGVGGKERAFSPNREAKFLLRAWIIELSQGHVVSSHQSQGSGVVTHWLVQISQCPPRPQDAQLAHALPSLGIISAYPWLHTVSCMARRTAGIKGVPGAISTHLGTSGKENSEAPPQTS